jgi:histidinol-phosphatase
MAERFQRELHFATDLAADAGALVLKVFESGGLQTSLKEDASPVTVADIQAESLIRERIRKEFPEDGIVGEEKGEEPGSSGRRWIIDPIDGTKSFIQGVPLYAVLIALESAGQPSVGVAFFPGLDELICAARGEGCLWKGKAASVSTVSTLEDACVVYTYFRLFAEAGPRGLRAWERLGKSSRLLRGWGDAYGYLLVATGRAEVMVDARINPWDIAALVPILQEAGGTLTDWDGNRTIHGENSVATNGVLLKPVLELLKP